MFVCACGFPARTAFLMKGGRNICAVAVCSHVDRCNRTVSRGCETRGAAEIDAVKALYGVERTCTYFGGLILNHNEDIFLFKPVSGGGLMSRHIQVPTERERGVGISLCN